MQLPDLGSLPALDLVKAPGELSAALAGLLADVVVAGDLDQARDVIRAHPALRVVTRAGDLLGAQLGAGRRVPAAQRAGDEGGGGRRRR